MAPCFVSQWLAVMTGAALAAEVKIDKKSGETIPVLLKKNGQLLEKILWNGGYYLLPPVERYNNTQCRT
ncbi:hypothetical protein JXQ31_16015 [candidate division KSB1 bacterium]|nr:hypothetical protein [candidate division KSB1 bacterium]